MQRRRGDHAGRTDPEDLDITSDGRFAVVQDAGHTTFFELGGGAEVKQLPPSSGVNPYATNSIALTPDGARAVVINGAGTLQLYDLSGPVPVPLGTRVERAYPEDVDIAALLLRADVVISGDASPNPVTTGALPTYSFVIANNGPVTATDARFSDALPSGVTLASVTTSQGTCSVTTLIECDLARASPSP